MRTVPRSESRRRKAPASRLTGPPCPRTRAAAPRRTRRQIRLLWPSLSPWRSRAPRLELPRTAVNFRLDHSLVADCLRQPRVGPASNLPGGRLRSVRGVTARLPGKWPDHWNLRGNRALWFVPACICARWRGEQVLLCKVRYEPASRCPATATSRPRSDVHPRGRGDQTIEDRDSNAPGRGHRGRQPGSRARAALRARRHVHGGARAGAARSRSRPRSRPRPLPRWRVDRTSSA